MDDNGGEPYTFREVSDAYQAYIDSNPPPEEPPHVLAFLAGLAHNPRLRGVVVPVDNGDVGLTRGVPKTQTFVTWAPDHEQRDIVVYRIENLRSIEQDDS